MAAGVPISIYSAEMRHDNAAEVLVPNGRAVLVDDFDQNVPISNVEVSQFDEQEMANSPNSEDPYRLLIA